jgi:hypothetical protein
VSLIVIGKFESKAGEPVPAPLFKATLHVMLLELQAVLFVKTDFNVCEGDGP